MAPVPRSRPRVVEVVVEEVVVDVVDGVVVLEEVEVVKVVGSRAIRSSTHSR